LPGKDAVAIVGMDCLFPKAGSLRRYWQNICNRVDAIDEVPARRWRAEDYFAPDRLARDRVYSRWGGFLDDFIFDPIKWRIPPASLSSIEPVQLLALEVANRALIDAGYDCRDFPRQRTGVLFAVAGSHDLGLAYGVRTMLRHYLGQLEGGPGAAALELVGRLEEHLPEWTEDTFPGFLANVVAGRIARELDLGGPNYVVDAACAGSLAALHAGIEQLRSRTSDMVLVGGADVTNNAFAYMCFAKTHALSPRGRARPFDDSADGIALGEGVACIVVKRLADAERDGDRIYAVIQGIGTSSDGKNRSLTAPSPQGQTWALERAYEDAGFSPSTLTLIEAHGTGTVVGDSAEIKTLNHLLGQHGQQRQVTAIGSVKSMIGHTKTVAGLAGLVKTALALKHRVLPPTIGIDVPTSQIDFTDSPVYLNTQTRPWIADVRHPRRAGVSAFGFGGTNFHAVLEEYTGAFHRGAELDLMPRSAEVILCQRDSANEVLDWLRQLDQELATIDLGELAELAAALVAQEQDRGRAAHACRLAIVAHSIADLRQKVTRALAQLPDRASLNDPSGIYYSQAAVADAASVCFLYPGQGSQSVAMLQDLLVSSSWGQDLFSRADHLLADVLGGPLSRYMYPIPAFDEATRQRQCEALNDTRIAQPALGVIELFATALLGRFGIRPSRVAGHSYGEWVALQVAGCLSVEDLLQISAQRGRICAQAAQATPGGMVAVAAGAQATRAALAELGIAAELANLNAPEQTIIAGSQAALTAALEQLPRKGLRVRRIPVTAPFHTPLLQSAADQFATILGALPLGAPQLPVYSNTTGQRYAEEPAVIRQTLVRHIREPILFEEQVRRLYADGARVFIEAGPGKVLTDLVQRILKDEPVTALALDAPGRDGWTQLGHLLGRAAVLGLSVQLGPWFEGRGLAATSPADFIARARAAAKPKPTDWIISACRAQPVTPLPRRPPIGQPAPPEGPADAKTPSPSPPANASVRPPAAQVAPSSTPPVTPPAVPPAGLPTSGVRLPATSRLNEPTTQVSPATMTTNSSALVPKATPPEIGATGAELFAQFQAATRHFLEAQQGQQRLTERFLETQERMLLYCLQGVPQGTLPPTPTPALSAPASVATGAPAALRVRSVTAGARPPVVLPTRTASQTNGSPVVHAAPQPPTPVAVAQTRTAAAEPASNGQAQAVPSDGSAIPPPPETAVFRRDLLQVVSERTGYPVDMLDETLPLEAGLGIDSIKTIEIFSKLKQYHVYTRETSRDLNEEEILASFTKLKTLRDVIDSYDQTRRAYLDKVAVAHASPAAAGPPAAEQPASVVERHTVRAVAAPQEGGDAKKNSPTTT
jgi:polyketide-type polyunsaturated fatty acid synthase PfaA